MIRRFLFIAALSGMVTGFALGQTLQKVDDHVQIVTANERTTLDRDTRELVSTVDVRLFNLGGRILEGPFHLVVHTTGDSVRVEGALGGTNDPLYQASYVDLSAQLTGNQLVANGTMVTSLSFRYPRETPMTYGLDPRALLVEERAPQLTVLPFTSPIQEGESLTIQVEATDPDGDPVTLSARPAISNARFSAIDGAAATGTLLFNPTNGQAGVYTLRFVARDPLGLSTSVVLQIEVLKANRAPGISELAPRTLTAGESLLLEVPATDPDGDTLTVNAEPLPTGAVISPTTRQFLFTPGADGTGVFSVGFSASDGTLTSPTQNLEITVLPLPFVATNDTNQLTLVVDPVESPTLSKRQRISGFVNVGDPPEPRPIATSALITGLNPSTVEAGDEVELIITGQGAGLFATHFHADASRVQTGPGIEVQDVTVQGPQQMTARIAVDPDATPGPREVTVLTSNETAVSLVALTVQAAAIEITGSLIDAETSNGVANALVTVQGTGFQAITDGTGAFSINGVPPGDHVLIVNGPDHELLRFTFTAAAGTPVVLGPLPAAPTVFDPSAPASVSVPSILRRGLFETAGGLTPEEARAMVIDTMLLVGGTQAGALDEYGKQLNPRVIGPGQLSLTADGVRILADRMERGGGTIGLGELFYAISYGFTWSAGEPPTLEVWLELFQELVNEAWQQPNNPDNYLLMLVFNRSARLSPNPPVLTPDMRLSPMQSFLLFSSLMVHVAVENDLVSSDPSVNDDRGWFTRMLASVTRAVSDLLVPSAFAEDPPPPEDNRYASSWNRFSQNLGARAANSIQTANALAMKAYYAAIGGMAVPTGGTLIGLSIQSGVFLAVTGAAHDALQDIFRTAALASQVPEPPFRLSYKIEQDLSGNPVVAITFPRSTSHRKTDSMIYTLYRFRGPQFPRELVATLPSWSRNSSDLRTKDFNTLFNEFTMYDRQPLRMEVGVDGELRPSAAATWFYSVTVTRIMDPDDLLDDDFFNRTTPWFESVGSVDFSNIGLLDYISVVRSSNRALTSDYSQPRVVRVTEDGDPPALSELEIDPLTGDAYIGVDNQEIYKISDEGRGARELWARTGFAAPGHRGLAVDSAGNLYSLNAASESRFGGRLFQYAQPSGARSHAGSINYYSQLLSYANPVAGGPMAMGPGENPANSPEDLYIVDELPNQVKRAPVQASYNAIRRVAQPWVDLPYSGNALDLAMEDDGDGALLYQRLAGESLTMNILLDAVFAVPGQTVTVSIVVGNPGGQPITDVAPTLLQQVGDGRLFLLSGPDAGGTNLAPRANTTFIYTYVAGDSGLVRLRGAAEGQSSQGFTVSSPTVNSINLEISGPLRITEITPSATHIPPNGPLSLQIEVQNRSEEPVLEVSPRLDLRSPLEAGDLTGSLVYVNGPLPSNTTVAAESSVTFSYNYLGGDLGRLRFLVRAEGENAEGDPVVTAELPSPIVEVTPAFMEILAPQVADLDSTFSVTARVYNIGSTMINQATPSVRQIGGGGKVALLQTPSPASASIAPGNFHDFVFTFSADDNGQVLFRGTASLQLPSGASITAVAEDRSLTVGSAIFGTVLDVIMRAEVENNRLTFSIDDESTPMQDVWMTVRDVSTGQILATNSVDSQGRYSLPVLGPGQYRLTANHLHSKLDYAQRVLVGDEPEEVTVHLPFSLHQTSYELLDDLQNITFGSADLELFLALFKQELEDPFQWSYTNSYSEIKRYLDELPQDYDTPIYEGLYRGFGRAPNAWDALVRLNLSMAYTLRRAEEVRLPAFLVVRGFALMLLTSDAFTKQVMKPADMAFAKKYPNAQKFLNPSGRSRTAVKHDRVAIIMLEFAAERGVLRNLLDNETKDAFYYKYLMSGMFKLTRFLMAASGEALAGDAIFEVVFQAINFAGTEFFMQQMYINSMTDFMLIEALNQTQKEEVEGDTLAIMSALSTKDGEVREFMNTNTERLINLHTLNAVIRGVAGLQELGFFAKKEFYTKRFTAQGVSQTKAATKRLNLLLLGVPNLIAIEQIMVEQPGRVCLGIQAAFRGQPAFLDETTAGAVQCIVNYPVIRAELEILQ